MDIMTISNISLSFAIAAGILIICGIAVAWFIRNRQLQLLQMRFDIKQWRDGISTNMQSSIVTRTNELMDCVVRITTTITVLRWHEFRDSHDMNNVTRTHLSNFASDCAEEVRKMLNISNIDFTRLLCTKEYLYFLIINTAFTQIKKLMETEFNEFPIN